MSNFRTPQGKPKIRVISVTIYENRETDRWHLHYTGHADNSESHPTAAEALTAVQEMRRVLANAGFSTAINVLWRPSTTIRRQVVKALQ